jgi:hypothetical protein
MSRHSFVQFLSRVPGLKHLPLPKWLVRGLEGSASTNWASPYKALSRTLCGKRALNGWCNLPTPCPLHDDRIPLVVLDEDRRDDEGKRR